jgi:AAA family ATP:ADP antiporter
VSNGADAAAGPGLLERSLRVFAPVGNREGVTSLLLLANVFLVLMAYYFIKPVREGWLSVSDVAGLSKLEIKAYSAFAQSLLLILVLPLYAMLAARLPRRTLILRVGGGFTALLGVFWLLQPDLLVPVNAAVGVAFYLFVGIFGVTLVAQFWSFASDMYGEGRGERLFPLVAIGASAGATVGAWAGEKLIRSEWLDAGDLVLLAAVPLVLALWLAAMADRRGPSGRPSAATRVRWAEAAAPGTESGYRLIAEHRYLAGIALMTLVFNWVVANGDNILFAAVQEALATEFAGARGSAGYAALINAATTAFYGDLYFWVNLLGLLLQAFVVSRLVAIGGVPAVLLVTPIVSFVAYFSMALSPLVSVLKTMKIAENATNYSLNNTARHMLWLPTSKTMLYKAKPTVDTLFVRIGDGLAAVTVLLGTRVWHLEVVQYFQLNMLIVCVWVLLAFYLVRENRRWAARAAQGLPDVPVKGLTS